ncbi:hypothetical protein CsatB_021624 [Cannabis sativa]
MPKSDEDDAYMCLKNLVDVIENAKEEAVKKQAEDEEAKLKDKEDEKVKTEKEKLEKESEPKTDNKEVKENGSVST